MGKFSDDWDKRKAKILAEQRAAREGTVASATPDAPGEAAVPEKLKTPFQAAAERLRTGKEVPPEQIAPAKRPNAPDPAVPSVLHTGAQKALEEIDRRETTWTRPEGSQIARGSVGAMVDLLTLGDNTPLNTGRAMVNAARPEAPRAASRQEAAPGAPVWTPTFTMRDRGATSLPAAVRDMAHYKLQAEIARREKDNELLSEEQQQELLDQYTEDSYLDALVLVGNDRTTPSMTMTTDLQQRLDNTRTKSEGVAWSQRLLDDAIEYMAGGEVSTPMDIAAPVLQMGMLQVSPAQIAQVEGEKVSYKRESAFAWATRASVLSTFQPVFDEDIDFGSPEHMEALARGDADIMKLMHEPGNALENALGPTAWTATKAIASPFAAAWALTDKLWDASDTVVVPVMNAATYVPSVNLTMRAAGAAERWAADANVVDGTSDFLQKRAFDTVMAVEGPTSVDWESVSKEEDVWSEIDNVSGQFVRGMTDAALFIPAMILDVSVVDVATLGVGKVLRVGKLATKSAKLKTTSDAIATVEEAIAKMDAGGEVIEAQRILDSNKVTGTATRNIVTLVAAKNAQTNGARVAVINAMGGGAGHKAKRMIEKEGEVNAAFDKAKDASTRAAQMVRVANEHVYNMSLVVQRTDADLEAAVKSLGPTEEAQQARKALLMDVSITEARNRVEKAEAEVRAGQRAVDTLEELKQDAAYVVARDTARRAKLRVAGAEKAATLARTEADALLEKATAPTPTKTPDMPKKVANAVEAVAAARQKLEAAKAKNQELLTTKQKTVESAKAKAEKPSNVAPDATDETKVKAKERQLKAQDKYTEAKLKYDELETALRTKLESGPQKALDNAEKALASAKSDASKAADGQKAADKQKAVETEADAADKQVTKTEEQLRIEEVNLKASEKALEQAEALIDTTELPRLRRMNPEQLTKRIKKAEKAIKKTAPAPANLAKLEVERNYLMSRLAHENALKKVGKEVEFYKQTIETARKKGAKFVKQGQRKTAIRHAKAQTRYYRTALQSVRDQLVTYRAFVASDALNEPFNFEKSLSAKARDVRPDTADAFRTAFRRRYGVNPPRLEFNAKGEVANVRAIVDAEKAAFYIDRAKASRGRQAGELVMNTVESSAGNPFKHTDFTKRDIAATVVRIAAAMRLRAPVDSLGLAGSSKATKDAFKRFEEASRVLDVELGNVAKAGGSEPWSAVDEYLWTTNPVSTDASQQFFGRGRSQRAGTSMGNRIVPPGENAFRYLRNLARAALKESGVSQFAEDVAVKAIVNAPQPSTYAGRVPAQEAANQLYNTLLKDDVTISDFRTHIEENIRRPYVDHFGKSDVTTNIDRFVVRGLMHAHLAQNLADDFRTLALARTTNPPGGAIDAVLDTLTTRNGKLKPKPFVGDVNKTAMQETMDILQDFGLGVESTYRAGVDTSSELANVVGGLVNTQEVLVRRWLNSPDDGDIWLPAPVLAAIQNTPSAIAKELVQVSDKARSGRALGPLLSALQRDRRMKVVGGHKFFRWAMMTMDTFGDWGQMALNTGPVMTARVVAKAAAEIVPFGSKATAKLTSGMNVSSKVLDDILDGTDGVFKAADGDLSYRELAKELVEEGTADSIISKDMHAAMMSSERVKDTQTKWKSWMESAFNLGYDQSEYVKFMQSYTEGAMTYKRKTLYLEARRTMSRDQAGQLVRDTLIDWSGGVAQWERASVLMGRFAAFWSHTRGMLNLQSRMVIDDLADLDAGRVAKVLLTGKAKRPMIAERIMSIPAELADREMEERAKAGDQSQATMDWMHSRRPSYMADMAWWDSQAMPEGMQTRMKDAYGRDTTVSSVYLARQNTQFMLMNSMMAYNLAYAATAGFDNDDTTMVHWDALLKQTVEYGMNMFANDMQYGGFLESAIRDLTGLEDRFQQSAESRAKYGTAVPPVYAGFLNDWGLGEHIIVKNQTTGRYVWRSPRAAKFGISLIETFFRAGVEVPRLSNLVMDAKTQAAEGHYKEAMRQFVFKFSGFGAETTMNPVRDAEMAEDAKVHALDDALKQARDTTRGTR